jgi:hypothetical protein
MHHQSRGNHTESSLAFPYVHDDKGAVQANGLSDDRNPRNQGSVLVVISTYGTALRQGQTRTARCERKELYDCILWNAFILLTGKFYRPSQESVRAHDI